MHNVFTAAFRHIRNHLPGGSHAEKTGKPPGARIFTAPDHHVPYSLRPHAFDQQAADRILKAHGRPDSRNWGPKPVDLETAHLAFGPKVFVARHAAAAPTPDSAATVAHEDTTNKLDTGRARPQQSMATSQDREQARRAYEAETDHIIAGLEAQLEAEEAEAALNAGMRAGTHAGPRSTLDGKPPETSTRRPAPMPPVLPVSDIRHGRIIDEADPAAPLKAKRTPAERSAAATAAQRDLIVRMAQREVKKANAISDLLKGMKTTLDAAREPLARKPKKS